MKTRICLLILLSFGGLLQAQYLNEQGLYVDNEGGLFTGTLLTAENNCKQQLSVSLGVKEGEARYFYPGGTLMEKGFFSKGQKEDQWTRYDNKGNVSAIGFYHAGKKSGTWLVFDGSGMKRFEMSYTDGQKSGTWTSWDEQGHVLEIKDYSQVN